MVAVLCAMEQPFQSWYDGFASGSEPCLSGDGEIMLVIVVFYQE